MNNSDIELSVSLNCKFNIDLILNCILIILLIIISIIDLKYMVIPNWLNAVLVLIGVMKIVRDISFITDRFAGLLIGFIFFMLIAILTNAMGGGDIKLMAALGLIFGIKGVLFITLFSFVIGAVVSIALLSFKIKNKKDKIPFGPFISLSATLYIIYGAEIINWYINIIV